ncbi:hypothetical protein AALI21_13040 [Corynebacteriaceae bacterium 6-324]
MDENERARKSLKLFTGNIVPRIRLIFKDNGLRVSFALALLLTFVVDKLPIAEMEVSSLAGLGLSFASISLGACFTTAVLALSLPGHNRIRAWSRKNGEISTSTALSDLLFVITWAALSQVLLILTCAGAIVVGGDLKVFPSGAFFWQRISVFCTTWVFLYAVSELLIVISTLNQVGNVIVHEERRDDCEKDV